MQKSQFIQDVEALRQKFPDLAKSLQIPNEDAFANLLAKSINQKLTREDDEALFNLQNMPQKIQISGKNDLGSMSVMHKLIAAENGGKLILTFPKIFAKF